MRVLVDARWLSRGSCMRHCAAHRLCVCAACTCTQRVLCCTAWYPWVLPACSVAHQAEVEKRADCLSAAAALLQAVALPAASCGACWWASPLWPAGPAAAWLSRCRCRWGRRGGSSCGGGGKGVVVAGGGGSYEGPWCAASPAQGTRGQSARVEGQVLCALCGCWRVVTASLIAAGRCTHNDALK